MKGVGIAGELPTLSYALLGLLAREPGSSGYDLARRMREWVGFFWHAPHSRIYPELARLQAAGLVEHVRVEQTERPDKKAYTLTEAGRAALRDWVSGPAPLPGARDEFVLRAFSLWLAEPAAVAARFREQEAAQRSQVAAYEAIAVDLEQRLRAQLRDPSNPSFASYVTLRRGLGFAREYAAWCAEVAGDLERSIRLEQGAAARAGTVEPPPD